MHPQREGEGERAAEADGPVTHRRQRHRHRRVVDAAERARGHRLHPVRHLEEGGVVEEGGREQEHRGAVRPRPVQEYRREQVRHREHDRAHQDHEARRYGKGDPRGPVGRHGVAPSRGLADPHGRRLGQPHRHHEGDVRELHGDHVGGDHRRAELPGHEHRADEESAFQQHRAGDRQPDPEDPPELYPVRPPEAHEDGIAPERAAEHGDAQQDQEHQQVHQGGRDPGAVQLEPRQAEMPEDQPVIQQRVQRHAGGHHPERHDRAVQRRDEVAQDGEGDAGRQRPHERAHVFLGRRQRRFRLPDQAQEVRGAGEHHERRSRKQDCDPQALADDAPHDARLPRAHRLGRQPRRRRDDAEADHVAQEEDHQRKRRAGEGIGAEMADHRDVGRHHRDPGELGQHDRRGQAQHLAQLLPPKGEPVVEPRRVHVVHYLSPKSRK